MIHVVAGIIWSDGRYLGVKRPEGKSHAGLWEFPGGKVEPGEDAPRAMVRELREELDIEVSSVEFWREKIHEYPGFTVRLSFFHIRDFKGVPRPMEGQGLRWVTPAEAEHLPFLEADRDIVTELLAHPRA
ncbi:(deoxy)nucleoside triphosphate pyrophosphohydrolase [Fundidesulfovibrio terrae]|uniref:(deoxy)nucleoside triphosphate pyrophosphohydrolase n=1 Tax=Fundidesulfovibrio terrae TaxID=2922866 RepID=UPI001FAFCAF2|nr:(deoxy)nucleoside triphosphate pyrophosphohydrolase [Fundidesulfovibrio terrae]